MKGLAPAILLVLAITCLVMAKPSDAINCSDVDLALSPCVSYLTGQQPRPSEQCCTGVHKLRDMAVATEDKRAACECAKAAASRFENLKDEAVSQLAAQCQTSVPFPISRNIDCSNLQL